ncbi:hypothetical protein [Saccharothrix algeriensis]|uniref:Transcriptional regulator n=1 Tax=Saccharothrix algeriensis TaxID=173560 RepID=A0ABS2S2R4_9PSEU|nr:hypothetical protein [Saccharothrix algeriensis]MBM7810532.1 putative transcriptional regulator [Saccharothrix algeriensis]
MTGASHRIVGGVDVSSVMGARLGRGPGVPAGYRPEALRSVVLVLLRDSDGRVVLVDLPRKAGCGEQAARSVCGDLAAVGHVTVGTELVHRWARSVRRKVYRLTPEGREFYRPMLAVDPDPEPRDALGGLDVSSVVGARFEAGLDPTGRGSYSRWALGAIVMVFLRSRHGAELVVKTVGQLAGLNQATARMVCRDLRAAGHLGVRLENNGGHCTTWYRLTPEGAWFYRSLPEVWR